MTRFEGGPAHDEVLMLHRSPKLLRVVISPRGRVDALDQLDDEPRPKEKVSVYERVGEPFRVHIRMSPRSASGYYAQATYKYLDEQPAADVIRDTHGWREWAVQFEANRAA